MRVLDLFAGLRGWSDPWKARGHEVVTLDNDPRFEADIPFDILRFAEDPARYLPWDPDVILASPPCEAFSVMTIGKYWHRDHQPKHPKAEHALRIVEATVDVIHTLRPSFFVIENPRGKLRRLPPVQHLERRTVTYCQYGEPYMKPTDLWGGFPPGFVAKACQNYAPCHVSAPRQSKTGIQGQLGAFSSRSPQRKELSALRAKIPAPLSLAICEAAERSMQTHDHGDPTP